MDELDFDERLRQSGAKVREIAPDRHEIAAALTAVGTRRADSRWIAPAALLAVAASVIGLLFWLTRPSDEAEPPADTSTPDAKELRPRNPGWSVDHRNWDGRGGWCLRLSSAGWHASGCSEGRRPARQLFALRGAKVVAFERVGPGGGPTEQTEQECDVSADWLEPNRLYDVECADGLLQVRKLPSKPVHQFAPVVSRGPPYEFDPIRVDGVRGVTAYLSQSLPGATEQCLVLLTEDRTGWQEACRDFTGGGRLAVIVKEALWVVDVSPAENRVSIASAATSASIYGCAEMMPSILSRLDRVSMADGLACSGNTGVVTTPRQGVTLRLTAGARPSRLCIGDADCDKRGSFAQPIAPGAAYQPATDHILRVDDLSADIESIEIPPEADASSIGFGVLDRFHDRGEVGPLPGMPSPLDPSVEVVDPRMLVLVHVPLLDDATGDETYVVWLDEEDDSQGIVPEFAIERLYRINTCARGITVEDGQRLCI